ncbi:DNRLRE domain-containing protein [Dyadobacter flavalbus]|uniref:DNRLRE domain-containing protein n=1 Tax=Dyadobacter flavalbus TaxID=2579942 RepID=A0A5M8QU46_9BACT|nr:malectin domain-containing carbohydrate-binding protein [Dyadobacter flavalbus]KAA6438570.1 DNRLRE domain-containing protein [Dyadobacter flavalbus]
MKTNLYFRAILETFTRCMIAIVFLHLNTSLIAQPLLQWEKTLGSTSSDVLTSVRPTSDGGFIAGGFSGGPVSGDKTQAGRGDFDYWVVKISSDGTKQWDKTFGGAMDDRLVQTFQAADGGYVLAGYSKSDAGSEKGANDKVAGNGRRGDFWIVKIDANGNKIWDKTIGGTSEDLLEDAKQTADGGYILAGSSLSGTGADKTQPSAGSRDIWVVRINSAGNIQWTQSIGGSHSERFTRIDITPDGGYILGGGVRALNASSAEAFVARLSATGSILWTRNLGMLSTEINDIIPSSDGGYLAAVQDQSVSDAPYVLVKLDSTGTLVWRKTYVGGPVTNPISDPAPTATLYAVRPTPDGGFLIGGGSNEHAGNDKSEDRKGRGGDDYWIIKTDANGVRQWDKTIGGLSGDVLYHLEPTADGGFILGGFSASDAGADKSEPGHGFYEDFWLVKLAAPPVDNRLVFSESKLDFNLVQGASTVPKTVYLKAFQGNPVVTLTKSLDNSWLVLPAPSAGTLSFGINAAGLLPGTYTTSVIARASGYTSDTLEVNLIVKPLESLVTIRIDAGGSGFTTSDGRVFSADQYYSGVDRTYKTSDANGIQYTADDELYRTERSATSFQYNIPVNNGDYVVVLHFAEIWFGVPDGYNYGPGSRRFHVDVEGERKLADYDIYAKGNGPLTAIEETFPVSVTDGTINIDFISGAANLPSVSAIEIVPQNEYVKTISTLPVVADAYVHTYFPDENFGTAPELIVKSGELNITRNTYLKFQLNGFEQITSARLRIYGVNVQSTMKVGTFVYSVDNDSWTETGITYNNAPQNNPQELSHTTINDDPGYREVDVTDFVQSQVAGDKVVSLVLKNPFFVNKKLVFHSKENASGFAPQLLVTSHRPVGNAARASAEPQLVAEAFRKEESGSVVFPNPVKKQIRLKLSGRHEGDMAMKLIDRSGRSFAVKRSIQQASTDVIDISNLSLKPGIYLLQIQSEQAVETIKVMVAE